MYVDFFFDGNVGYRNFSLCTGCGGMIYCFVVLGFWILGYIGRKLTLLTHLILGLPQEVAVFPKGDLA
jgi:hypothetical protein